MRELKKATLWNGLGMYKELDKIGAYPEYTTFFFNGNMYEILENDINKNYIYCFNRLVCSNGKKVKFYKWQLFKNNKPSLKDINITCDYACQSLHELYTYDDDKSYYRHLKHFLNRKNKYIQNLFINESNPFNKLLRSL